MPDTRTRMQSLVDEAQQALTEARGFNDQIISAAPGTLTEARRTELETSYATAFARAKQRKALADQLAGEAAFETELNALTNTPVLLHPQGPGTTTLPTPTGSTEVRTMEGQVLGMDMPHQFLSAGNTPASMRSFIQACEMRASELETLRAIPEWKPAERAALNNYYRRHRNTAMDPVETRTLTPYVDDAGGYIVTREMRSELMRQERDLVQIRRYARVIRTNAASVAFPSFKDVINLEKQRALKNIQVADIREVLGIQQFVPAEFAIIVKVPQQLIEDSMFALTNFLAEEIALQSSEDEERLFLTGTGKNEPYGILTAPIYAVDATVAGAVAKPEDYKGLPYEIRSAFRRRGKWMFNRRGIQAVSKMREDSGAGAGTGNFLWQMGLQAGEPDRFVGYEALESEHFPLADGVGKPHCLFFDPLQYWIVDRLNLSLERLDQLYAETSEIGFKYRKRFTAAPVRLEAFVRLNRI